MTGPREALELLEAAAAAGDLAQVCGRHGVDLLIAFGSAVREGGAPHDLDLGRAGPVARERPFLGGRLLYKASPSLAATAQIAATMERLDTAWLRELDLRLLAAGGPR